MEAIIDWLQSPDKDYDTGIALLQPISRNKYLVKQLAKKQSKRNLAKLIYELHKRVSLPACPAGRPPKGGPPTEKEAPLIDQEQQKKAVEKLETALGKMHNKKGMLSNQLRTFDASDNEGRKVLLKQIDTLNEDMNSIRNKLDYYHTNGRLPPLPEPPTKEKERN
jgi:hypothetical protein